MFSFAALPQGAADDRVEMVDAATVRQWYEAGEAVLVDVREPNEYANAHIPGAQLNPLSRFDPARVPAPEGKRLVIHCRSGSRCGLAAMRLLASGFEGKVHRMQGGIIAWHAAGGALEAGF